MRSRRDDLVLAGHGFLAGSMALWRAVESTPFLTSKRGGGILGHPAGEVLLALWMLVAVGTLAGVAAGTLLERRATLFALAAALAAALGRRQGLDVFDLVYLLVVPVAIALHVERRRSAPTEPAASAGTAGTSGGTLGPR